MMVKPSGSDKLGVRFPGREVLFVDPERVRFPVAETLLFLILTHVFPPKGIVAVSWHQSRVATSETSLIL